MQQPVFKTENSDTEAVPMSMIKKEAVVFGRHAVTDIVCKLFAATKQLAN